MDTLLGALSETTLTTTTPVRLRFSTARRTMLAKSRKCITLIYELVNIYPLSEMTQKDICIKLDLVSSLVAKKYTDKKLKRLKKTNDK